MTKIHQTKKAETTTLTQKEGNKNHRLVANSEARKTGSGVFKVQCGMCIHALCVLRCSCFNASKQTHTHTRGHKKVCQSCFGCSFFVLRALLSLRDRLQPSEVRWRGESAFGVGFLLEVWYKLQHQRVCVRPKSALLAIGYDWCLFLHAHAGGCCGRVFFLIICLLPNTTGPIGLITYTVLEHEGTHDIRSIIAYEECFLLDVLLHICVPSDTLWCYVILLGRTVCYKLSHFCANLASDGVC